MMTAEDNDLLCRVEGDAPMGQLMRRHWQPVCLSEEVLDPDGAPVKARVLGEDLVVFRDSDGRIGVLAEQCPHRGVSLVYGRNEEGGLRCLYHGWKFDVRGQAVEMPSEPAQSALMDKVRIKAYPTHEHGGVVWTYMGPPQGMPEFAPPPWAPTADTKVSIVKMVVDCNWAQVLEGAIDSAHSSSLHSSDIVPARVSGTTHQTGTMMRRPSTDKAPRIQVQATEYGFKYAAIRRPIQHADLQDYVRMTIFVAPGSFAELANRLRWRRSESDDEIEQRLAAAAREMQAIDAFDYVVINREDRLDEAAGQIRSIVTAQKHLVHPRRVEL